MRFSSRRRTKSLPKSESPSPRRAPAAGEEVTPIRDDDRWTMVTRTIRSSGIRSSASRSRSSALPPWMPRKAACLPAATRGAVLAHVADHLEIVGDALEDALQPPHVLDEGVRPALGRPQRIGGDHPDRAGQARLAHAREVHHREEARAEGAVAVTLAQVVAEDPIPDERIDVQVDRLAGQVDLDGLARDAEFACPAGGVGTVIAVDEFRHRALRVTEAPRRRRVTNSSIFWQLP